MSTFRITQRMMVDHSLASMQTGLGRLSKTQEQLSTGRVINRPSDDPTGTNAAMRYRQQLASNDQYSRNADNGLGWLRTADNTMMSMVDSTRRARDLILQGSSTGNSGPEARQALKTELIQIRDSLISDANTTYLGRPVFGGTTANNAAYDGGGGYIGTPVDATGTTEQGQVFRTVGDGERVRVDVTGPEAFSTKDGTSNLFAVLQSAIDNMEATPANLGGDLTALDDVTSTMKSALADVGAREGRVEDTMSKLADSKVDLTASLSSVENVDVAAAAMELQMQEVAYQAALGATARVLQPSLIDFLR